MTELRAAAERLQNTLTYAAPEVHTLKIEDAVAEYALRAVLEEREACCAVLASAAPNTKAEAVIEKISAVVGDCPPHVAGLISEWLEATADELADLQKAIRARGPKASQSHAVAASVPVVTAGDSERRTGRAAITSIEIRPNGEWARFLLEESGMLAVCSTCGNYSFTWTGLSEGTSLTAFLLHDDPSYVRSKFEYQFHGKLSRLQQTQLGGFFKKIWPAFIEALKHPELPR